METHVDDGGGEKREVADMRQLMKTLMGTNRVYRQYRGLTSVPWMKRGEGDEPGDRLLLCKDCDEVYPGILIGDGEAARDIKFLQTIGITHVLNTAEGTRLGQVSTSEEYYKGSGITYKGLCIVDLPVVKISEFFDECCDFIELALQGNGRILVHCLMGMSRSVTMVLAYLMRNKKMWAVDALQTVLDHRSTVRPNDGFLRQICEYDQKLHATHSE